VVPALARVKHDLMPDLQAGGLTDRIGAGHNCPTLPTAVAAYREEQDVAGPPTAP
jgi:sulfate permease, SulP family